MNLGGISSTLFESEMFGHVRGAFTDARADRKGRFEMAHGGTIFLDEIGELDPASQVKLLRVLQDRTFEVLGSSQRREVDVRVVSATNRDLAEMVARGEFREDLLYRLNLIAIHLPPLRERPDDIPLLASRFLQAAAAGYRREAADADAGGGRAGCRRSPGRATCASSSRRSSAPCWSARRDRLDVERLHRCSPRRRDASRPRDSLPDVGAMTIDEIERAMIVKSLRHHGGNISKVAESLGLSRAALYRRFEKYEIAV